MAYQVTARIGRGGMGVVDLATDERGRQFALKRLALHGSEREMMHARQRIRREAEILSGLHHPGIVELLEVIDDGDDIVLVMPYLPGGTLAEHVHHHGPLPPDRVMVLAGRLLDALSAAHRQGVIHRDIKPANILFDADGWPRLTDFGTAVARDATSGLTMAGTVIGTPEYMSPEQARGQDVTAATDIFSLGATLRFAATGAPPFGRGDPAVVIQRAAKCQLEPWPPRSDRQLRRFLSRMLHHDPAKRPSAAGLVGGPSGTDVMHPPRGSRRKTVMASVGISALVVATAAIAFISVGSRSEGIAMPSTTDRSSITTMPSTTPCRDLPYQPCGEPAAPFTDGVKCLADHADYDGDRSNGCEAAPDDVDGTELIGTITANLVPGTDIDTYPFHVADNFQLFCDGTVRVTLTAPATTSMRLEIIDGSAVIATTVASNGNPSTLALTEPNCMGDDTTDLVARVSWVGAERSSEPYRLTVAGSY